MPSSTPDLRGELRAIAHAEGFDVVRFAKPELRQQIGRDLWQFLAEGRHGTMEWLARNPERRSDPEALWDQCRSVIVLGVNYGPAHDPREALLASDRAAISCYAQGDDYHEVIKARLKRVGRLLAERYAAELKVFVDTAPVMEKPLAQAAGIGWQGKHTNLVSRSHGSWLFLGSIFTTLEIPPDQPETTHCGGCTRCLEVCPTQALGPFQINAKRCISYLTIEHKGHIPAEFRTQIGNRVYGCDDCLAVCPWNKFASAAGEARFHARAELLQPRLADLVMLKDDEFRALFRKSPIKRIGRDRFVRNVLIAIGNSGNVTLVAEAERLLGDDSPLVRAMAVWAISRLSPTRAALLRDDSLVRERDDDVRAEWHAIASVLSPVH